jgi:hypothetical protein
LTQLYREVSLKRLAAKSWQYPGPGERNDLMVEFTPDQQCVFNAGSLANPGKLKWFRLVIHAKKKELRIVREVRRELMSAGGVGSHQPC